MGLIDRFFPGIARRTFATRVAAAMRKAGETRKITYVPESFGLKLEGDGAPSIQLENVYQEHLAVPLTRRHQHIKSLGEAFIFEEMPDTLDEARQKVLPRVRERFWKYAIHLHSRATGREMPDFPSRELSPCHEVELALDNAQSISTVGHDQLEKWGVSSDELMKIARENLWRMSNKDFVEIAPGTYGSDWQDNWDASRLVLHDLIWQLKVKGKHVATTPHRDMLIVTGSEDADGLKLLADLTEQSLDHPRIMTGVPVVLEDDKWVRFELPEDHPAGPAIRRLNLIGGLQEYSEQADLLEKIHQAEKFDVFIASFSVAEREDGSIFSYCVLGEGIHSWLPKTDKVALIRDENGKPGETLGFATWDSLTEVMGDAVKPLGMYPERYEVTTFPTAEQIEKMSIEQ